MKIRAAIMSLMLFLSFTGFSTAVDSLSIEILQKTLKKHHSLDSIRFHYNYTVQIMDQDFNWAEEKDLSGNRTVTKDDLESYDKEYYLVSDAFLQYISTLSSIRKAIEINKTKLSCGCNPVPYHIINLSDIPFKGRHSMKYYKNQTVYIDTLTFLVHAITTVENGDDGKVILSTFTMDSVITYKPAAKIPAIFMLNRNMLKPGEMAPAFSLKDAYGKTVNLSDFKGRLVLLDFWYAACKPCIKASFNLDKLQEDFASRGLVVLGMNTMDKAGKIKRHTAKFKMNYNTLLCPRDIKTTYKINSYPSFYLIDETGKIVFSTSGYSSDLASELESAILQALSD